MLAQAVEGETPLDFGLRIMRDADQPVEIRILAARLAAPYMHARPGPEGESVTLDLPPVDTIDGVTKAAAAVLRAVSESRITVSVGRDLVSIIDAQRRSMELIDIDRRLTALEAAKGFSQ